MKFEILFNYYKYFKYTPLEVVANITLFTLSRETNEDRDSSNVSSLFFAKSTCFTVPSIEEVSSVSPYGIIAVTISEKDTVKNIILYQ